MQEDTIELTEEPINHCGHLDDGRDWTNWHVWRMRNKFRIRSGIIEPQPVRPQIMPPQQPPKKKRAKAKRKKKQADAA